jgi:hypothetical protein
MRFACWITKATDTRSEYIILIAFPRQQWLRERASRLHYTHTVCLVRHAHVPHALCREFVFMCLWSWMESVELTSTYRKHLPIQWWWKTCKLKISIQRDILVFHGPFQPSGFSGEGGVETTLSITEGTEKNAKPIKGGGEKTAPSSSYCSDESFGWEESRKTTNFLSRRRIRSPQAINCFLTSSIFTSILCTRWATIVIFLAK